MRTATAAASLMMAATCFAAAGNAPVGNGTTAPGAAARPDGDTLADAAASRRDTVDHNRAFAIGKKLRCPVCQGMPIAESPSATAQDMMKLVQEQLSQGKSEDDILAFFVARYGEWVLLDPPARGFGLWVWVLPPVGALLAVAWVLRQVRRLRRGPLSPASQVSQMATGETDAHATDPYLQAIRDEVQR